MKFSDGTVTSIRSISQRGLAIYWARLDVIAAAYCSEVLIEVNLVLSLVPSPFTTAMMASEMPAASRAYSMAVAPDSSARNARSVFMQNIGGSSY